MCARAPCLWCGPLAQLTDFGIARSVASGRTMTSEIGTAQFMPPEAIGGAGLLRLSCAGWLAGWLAGDVKQRCSVLRGGAFLERTSLRSCACVRLCVGHLGSGG